MAVKPLWTSPPQWEDANGNPYSGAKLFFYAAGSSTKQNTFTDDGGGTPCDNPMTLNASGYPAMSGTVITPWGTVGQTYKIGLAIPGSADPPASFIWQADDISAINDTSVAIDQWVSGPTPTYIGATSFSLVGDQTSTFQVGRRLKTTNSGGTVYSTITASAYGAVTTVTVLNDASTLDAGLSAVSYGLLSPTNPSTPNFAGPSSNAAAPAGQIFMRGGQIGFPATQVASTNANTLDDYEEGTFTASLTGCTTVPTYTAYYTKVGDQVTLRVSPGVNMTGTSNATTKTLTGCPAALFPARAQESMCVSSDNGGARVIARCDIGTGGVITLYPTITGTDAWTNSGTATIIPFGITYTLA